MPKQLLILCLMMVPFALHASDIRFYKINKKEQQTRIVLYGGAKTTGCHNFPHRPRVHRIAQVGYTHCSAYTTKDCAADSIVKVRWKSTPEKKTQMTPGARWFLPGERGIKLASWNCLTE